MKVLDLGCPNHHVFEGWFASEDDFQTQLAQGLLVCPVCSDRAITKRLSAPRLNLKAGGETVASPAANQAPQPAENGISAARNPTEWQAALARAAQELLSRTEDVGDAFPQEARRMHAGEAKQRNIRGKASWAETVELLEEGIEVLPLPDLPLLKGPLH